MTTTTLSETSLSAHGAAPVRGLLQTPLREASATTDLESLLQRFLLSIMELAGAQAGAVRVLTDDGLNLRLVAQMGLPASVAVTEAVVEGDCGICGLASGEDTLVWIQDLRSCARHSGESFFGLQCQRVLAISLPFQGQILGVYNLFFDDMAELAPQTQTILRLIGHLLGQTLHNARIERERLRVTVMKERQEMVNEVHDSLAQTLAYVKMRLPLLNEAILAHDDGQSMKYLADVRSAVSQVHHNLREVMAYFRTRMDPLGLLHALHGIAAGFYDQHGIALEIRNRVQNLHLSDEQEVQVFHILQEALANISKHSMARCAVITIQRDTQALEFLVEDDGLGMTAPLPSAQGGNHFGLNIMQERARRLGADVTFSTHPGGGTAVRLVLPSSDLGVGVTP